MIDVHCHLEQKDYSEDRDSVVAKCRKELNAIVTSCAHPKDFDLTLNLVEKYVGFVFATVGIHPEYIKEVNEKEKDDFIDLVKKNRGKIVGIGEVGLDYNWVKESDWREKQKDLFINFINLSNELKLPLVVHARDAFEEAIKILEHEDARRVVMHMFGANNLVKYIIENKWFVSLNTIVLNSKKYNKVARDMPLEQLLLETDSPWLGFEKKRNDPTSVKIVADKISEIKKTTFEIVDKKTTENAIEFFKLNLHY